MQERDLSRVENETLRLDREFREKFVQALTHDLRTPLTAAKMSAQLIDRKGEISPETRRQVMRIEGHLTRMDTMIRDLLDASRIKAGEKIPAHITECDLHQIASDVCDELTSIHGERFKLDRKEPLIGHWCPEGMRRIMENLLSNAVKYGEPGSPVTLALAEKADHVHLIVHNYGNSIDQEDQLRLFDIFRRAKSAERSDKKGWGIGLTLVRGLAEANGGIVKVESYPKEGTRFTVDLPRDARHMALPEIDRGRK
jgi:signal transduction histidine kinase